MNITKKATLMGVMLLFSCVLSAQAWAAQRGLICYVASIDDNGFNQSANQGATPAINLPKHSI